MRRYEAATAAALAMLAAVAMYDSRRGALIGATNDPGGIGSGFYPFWAATFMGLAAVVLVVRALSSPQESSEPFITRHGAVAVLKLAVPMVLYTALIGWLGMYLATGLYMGFFARYLGRYRWIWVLVIAVVFPAAMYLMFEQGFRLFLPKSILYGEVLPV